MARRASWSCWGIGRVAAICVAIAGVVSGCLGPPSRGGGDTTLIFPAPRGYLCWGGLAWSPDGSQLLARFVPRTEPYTEYRARPKLLYVVRLGDRTARPLGECRADPPPQFARDGRHIVLNSRRDGSATVALRDITTGEDDVVCRTNGDLLTSGVSQSLHGDKLAALELRPIDGPIPLTTSVVVVDFGARTARTVFNSSRGQAGPPCWSPRGELAWTEIGNTDSSIAIAQSPTGSIRRMPLPAADADIAGSAWSPDGAHLLVASLIGQFTVTAVDATTGRAKVVLCLSGFELNSQLGYEWSPDGALIAVGACRASRRGYESFVAIHSLSSSRTDDAKLVGPLGRNAAGLVWSPKGDAIAFSADDGVHLIQVGPLRATARAGGGSM